MNALAMLLLASAMQSAIVSDTVRFVSATTDSAQPLRSIDPASVPALRREIALDLRGVSRDAALVEIGRAAGITVVYAADLVPRTGAVTLTATMIPVSAALERALAGVPIDVVVGERGALTLMPRAASALVTIDGVVIDSVGRAPVRLAAVRAGTKGQTILTDDAGRFRLIAPSGTLELSVHRIGFRPAALRIDVPAGERTLNVMLSPGVVGLAPVRVTAMTAASATSPLADEIGARVMAAALARRASTRSLMHDYRFDAHVRLLERDDPAPEDSAAIVAVHESVVRGYWERPGRLQQTIVARRQAFAYPNMRPHVSLDPHGALAVTSFDADGWTVFGVPSTPLPSPIGPNALAHYRYAVLDTSAVDGRRVLRLAVRPASIGAPAFDGVIDVADSTFDILAVRVGVSVSADEDFALRNLQVAMRFGDVGAGRWMPQSIAMTLRGALLHGGVTLAAEYDATLGDFRFNTDARPRGVGEFPLVVAAGADRRDDDLYAQAPSLSRPEPPLGLQAGIDSGAAYARWNKPPDRMLVDLNDLTDVRFNRVDGWTYGIGGTIDRLRFSPALTPTVRLGRSFGSGRSTYLVGDAAVLSSIDRLSVSASVYDETLTPPAFVTPEYNPTFGALVAGAGADRQQYYREHGMAAAISSRLIGRTQLTLGYLDVRQSTLATLGRYARSDGRFGLAPTLNRPIDDGRLTAFSATIAYDSRPLLLQPHAYERISTNGPTGLASPGTFTHISLESELSSPATTATDFDYRRYQLRIERRQETWLLGVSDVVAVAGIADGRVPVQRLFQANGGAVLPSVDSPFATLGDSVYGGARAAAIVATHEFDAATIRARRIPLLRDLPLSFAVGGAALWASSGATAVHSAPSAYTEVGATVAYALPSAKHAPWIFSVFVPNSVAVRVSRQLSSYDTRRTRITIGIR